MAARFDPLERGFSADQSLGTAYLTLSSFLGTVRCGYSYANFFNPSDAVAAALFQQRSLLPFHFRWLGGRIVVERNLSGDPALVPGTVISRIDGIATEQILATLLPYARADGSNDDKQRALLEVRGGRSHRDVRRVSRAGVSYLVRKVCLVHAHADRTGARRDGRGTWAGGPQSRDARARRKGRAGMDVRDAGRGGRSHHAELGALHQQVGLARLA